MNGLDTVTSYFTPTVLFCFLNLTILTIFFLHPQKKQQYPPVLIRLPSLFDRSRSFTRPEPEPAQAAPSIFQRVKSIKLSVRSDPQPDPVQHEEPVQVYPVQEHVQRTKSETAPKVKKQVRKKVLKRSVSEMAPPPAAEVVYQRQPDTVREKVPVALGDAEVDGKCDDFINKFRQQLKLQRSDSILRYNEMLNRGASR